MIQRENKMIKDEKIKRYKDKEIKYYKMRI